MEKHLKQTPNEKSMIRLKKNLLSVQSCLESIRKVLIDALQQ